MRQSASSFIAAVTLLVFLNIPASGGDWDRGVYLYNKGNYKAALAEFQDIVGHRPDAAGAWYYIGLCEFKMNRYKRVQIPLARAIELLEVQTPGSPDIEAAWYTIGFSNYQVGDYDKAIEPLERYRSLVKKAGREFDPNARRALGRSYFFLERYDDALPLLSGAGPAGARPTGVRRDEDPRDYYYVGAIYFKREDDERAIAALRAAVEAKADDVGSMDLLAESLMRKARKSTSSATWLEAADVGEKLRVIRDDAKTAGVLGRAYLGGGQFEKAVPPLEKIARANHEDGQAWLYYGIALSRSGKMRKAMEALEITVQLLPDSMPALSELAYVYESDKQYQQALRIYERAYAVSGSSDPEIKQSIERVRALASQQP